MSRLSPPVGADDHADGPSDASVTLVEYGDYECPYCGEAYPVIKAVQAALGRRLRFVFRNFPITQSHPHALAAAGFAEAAASIGRFWDAHDMLYENQEALRTADLLSYGERIGLAREAVIAAVEGRYAAKIRTDFASGVRSGVNGTPTLFVDGERYDGPRDVDALVAALDATARLRD